MRHSTRQQSIQSNLRLGLLILIFGLQPFQQAWSDAKTLEKHPLLIASKNGNVPFKRIVSLAPHITEMLFSAGAGDKVVGVVSYSDYPQAALQIDNVGSYHSTNIEKIIQLNADLVIAWKSGNRPQDIARLQQLGLKVIFSEPRALKDIPTEIRSLGRQLGTQKIADKTADQLEQQLNELQDTYQSRPAVSAYYQIWNKPMMTINGQQFISQALQICGAQNIFSDLLTLTPEVDIESVIHQNPSVIFLGGQKSMQPSWLAEWQNWKNIHAVREQYIFPLEIDIFQRPTERFIKGIESLCQKVELVRAAQRVTKN